MYNAKKAGFKILTDKERYVTGKVILLFSNLEEPYAFNEKDDPKYSVTVLIPKDNKEEIENLKSIITKHFTEAKLKSNAGIPLTDGDSKKKTLEEEGKNGDTYEGMYVFRSNSKFKVKVLNSKLQNETREEELFQGCWCRLSVEFYAYHAGSNTGITSYLRGVQILGQSGVDLKIASSVVGDFDVEEDVEDDIFTAKPVNKKVDTSKKLTESDLFTDKPVKTSVNKKDNKPDHPPINGNIDVPFDI